MNCSKCNDLMHEFETTETKHDLKTGKEYTKVTYVCREDDIWVTTEIPIDQT